MDIKKVRALSSTTSAVIANNSAASPVVIPAQPGGGLRLGLCVRNTGSVGIEMFYDDETAVAGAGMAIEADASRSFADQLHFPACLSFRSLTSAAGEVEVSWVETDNA
ncbi:MAG: hypothetical protein WC740_07035 [Verrucomicrobiia bacterium]